MKAIVLDIETIDLFDSMHKKKPEDLSISVVGTYHYVDDSYHTYTVEELPELWKVMENIDTIIGFNSNHFDIPLLNKYAPIDLQKFHSIDILATIREALGHRIRLDWVARGTLGVQKSGKGTDAVTWWAKGEKEKVKKYCLDDVKITKQVFEYGRTHKHLKYYDLGSERKFPIDTSRWVMQAKTEAEYAPLF